MRQHSIRHSLSLALLLLAGGLASFTSAAPVRTGQHPYSFSNTVPITVQSRYLLYLPEDYATSSQAWPLILFLHGAGERGDDLEKVKANGPPRLIARDGKTFPFVIVSPQCPEHDWWASDLQIACLDALLTDIVSRYRIDRDRIYVTGLSMGGFGTWRLAVDYPTRFAAIAPVCGKGDPAQAARIRHLPVWAFHGAKDKTVPLAASQDMVEALKQAGGDVTFTVYPEAGHDSWTETYDNPDLYDWLLKHRRGAQP